VARIVTKPIDVLVKEMEEMAGGNYEGDLSGELTTRKDEFGKLGKALEIMKNQTLSLIRKLKSSNEELESSLEEIIAIESELRDQNVLLTESESKNRAIIRALPDLIFIIREDGVLLDCQTGDIKEMKYLQERFVGKNIEDIVSAV
jgi:PAS domain-containing protein